MSYKNVLIPLGPRSKDLKALHHALSLTERIRSRLFILSLQEVSEAQTPNPVMSACREIVQSACEEGLQVSFHIVSGNVETELVKLLEREHIDLVIINDSEIQIKTIIRRIMPLISCQVIQVKEKNDINFLR